MEALKKGKSILSNEETFFRVSEKMLSVTPLLRSILSLIT